MILDYSLSGGKKKKKRKENDYAHVRDILKKAR